MAVLVALLTAACESSSGSTAPQSSPVPTVTQAKVTPPRTAPSPKATIPRAYPPASRNPRNDITAALRLSKADHRPVLLDFGADWCPDCVVLNRLYHAKTVSPLVLSRYHLVLVNVGEFNLNLKVASAYINLDTSGIPALVVLRSSGSIVYASNDGAFANARTMTAPQVAQFLRRWQST